VLNVGVVDHTRRRHQRFEHDTQAHNAQPVRSEEGGVVAVEARSARVEGRRLLHHVHAVQEHDASDGVREPASVVPQRRDGTA
jgi:hypothetical protein